METLNRAPVFYLGLTMNENFLRVPTEIRHSITMGLDDRLRHDRLVYATLQRLAIKPGELHPFWEYERGECDILRLRGKHATYYEIKGHDCIPAVMKAHEQFRRFRRYHPQYNCSFILVTPERYERVRI